MTTYTNQKVSLEAVSVLLEEKIGASVQMVRSTGGDIDVVVFMPKNIEIDHVVSENTQENIVFDVIDDKGESVLDQHICILILGCDIDAEEKLNLEGAEAGILVIQDKNSTREDILRLDKIETELKAV